MKFATKIMNFQGFFFFWMCKKIGKYSRIWSTDGGVRIKIINNKWKNKRGKIGCFTEQVWAKEASTCADTWHEERGRLGSRIQRAGTCENGWERWDRIFEGKRSLRQSRAPHEKSILVATRRRLYSNTQPPSIIIFFNYN